MARLRRLTAAGAAAVVAAAGAAAAASPAPPGGRFAGFPPDTLPVRPAAVPLIVTDPMFSQWSPNDNLTDGYTVHWTIVFGPQGYKAMSALARVDGATFRLMGPECPPGATPALQQVGHPRVYPRSTVYAFAGAGVAINLTFTQPGDDGVDRGTGLPLSYVVFDVASADGAPHAVAVYLDATGQLAVNTDDELLVWARTNLSAAAGAPPGAAGLRIGTAAQRHFSGAGDDFRIDWGWLHLAAAPAGGAAPPALAAASSNRMRYWFVSNGTLPPDETVMPVPACANPTANGSHVCACQVPGEAGAANDWAALGAAWDLGTVSPAGGPAAAVAVVAYDDVVSARYFGVDQAPWWASRGRTMEEVVAHALGTFDAAMAAAVAADLGLVTALRAVGLGEAYERVASLAYRQALADNKLAAYGGEFGGATPPGMHMWVKGAASSGDTGTLDDNLPAFPLFLLAYPDRVPAFLTPLFMFARNETFAPGAPFPRNITHDAPFAPHYLGQNPDAELQCWAGGQCEPMPIEMSADALLLVAAHAAATGDYGFATAYWPLLARWAAYLVSNGLFPGSQRSSDDYEGFITNSTHLASKAISALAAFSQLCNATGRAADGAAAWATATAFRDTWLALAMDPGGGHSMLTYGAPGSASIKYSWLFDAGLGLGVWPAEVVDAECGWHAAHALPYGWVLQAPATGGNTWTNLGWEGWIAAVCNASVGADVFERILAYVGDTDRRVSMSDWYDAATARFQGFTARAQVGGVFAPLWLADMAARRGARREAAAAVEAAEAAAEEAAAAPRSGVAGAGG
jgi:hypothetical protein